MRKSLFVVFVLIMSAFAQESYSAHKISGVVNVNTATQNQLVIIPGIGEAKAQAIITERSKKPFGHIEDLMMIRGIGEKMLEKMKPFLTIKGPTTISKKRVSKVKAE